MKQLDKYILREYLLSLFYCLGTFCMLYVVYDLFDRISKFIDAKTPFLLIVRYYLFLLAPTIEFLVPAALLLATLYTLWQFTRNNELMAMRTSGISTYRIICPFLIIGMIFTISTATINEFIAPEAELWIKEFSGNKLQIPEHSFRKNIAYYNSLDHRLWLIGSFDLKNPNTLFDLKLTFELKNGNRLKELYVEKAEWLDGQWWFHNTQIQEYDMHDNRKIRTLPHVGDTIQEMPLLSEKPSDFVNEVKPWEYMSSLEILRYLKLHPNLSEEVTAQKKFDFHNRMAMPWACIIVILFGIPTGNKSGRQSALTGIFSAIAFFFGFYTLNQIGLFFGKSHLIEPWVGAWLSNIVFFIAGIGMMLRMR